MAVQLIGSTIHNVVEVEYQKTRGLDAQQQPSTGKDRAPYEVHHIKVRFKAASQSGEVMVEQDIILFGADNTEVEFIGLPVMPAVVFSNSPDETWGQPKACCSAKEE